MRQADTYMKITLAGNCAAVSRNGKMIGAFKVIRENGGVVWRSWSSIAGKDNITAALMLLTSIPTSDDLMIVEPPVSEIGEKSAKELTEHIRSYGRFN